MKKLRLIFAAWLAVAGGAAFAQNVVYTQGNAKIVQLAGGWQILCGESVVAHGDGTLDINNLPPAFHDFLDIYAEMEEPMADASKGDDEPVYGPLLSTQWNQYEPYNNEFPIVDGEGHALTGCTTTATAQILNYYKYCLPLNLSGTYYTSSSSIESPYISNVTKVEGGWNDGYLSYDYKFSYTPDFEKINTDDEHLAKFFLAIAFAQYAVFGLSGTGGNNEGKEIWNLYGYDMLPFTDDGKSRLNYNPDIEDLTTNDYIASAIKKGMPVNISGSSERGGHAFIIDGCHGNEFHINYGWGGISDGWYTTTQFPNGMDIFIAHPADTNAAFMQAEPKYLNIKDENGFNKKIEMEQSEDNQLEYKQKGNLKLESGVYEFCFEYADGSTIAPHTDSVIELVEVYSKQGRFVSTSKIEISNSYNVDFWIKQNKAEIDVVCADYFTHVSGRITDNNSNPIEGAIITLATTGPNPDTANFEDDDAVSDASGNYSLKIKRYSSGTLLAYHNYYTFLEQNLQNVGTELTDVDFSGLSKKVIVSGRVTDSNSKPIEGACVTDAETVPVIESEQKNDSIVKYTYLSPSDWYTTEFVALQPYMSKFEIKIHMYRPDNSLTVGILDETMEVLWQKKLLDKEIAYLDWTTMDFGDNYLHLEQGGKYYIALKVNTTKKYSYGYIGEGKGKMTYRIWWSSADFATTDAEGNYSIKVDRYFTGSLSVFHDDYIFEERQSLQKVETELADVDFAGLSKKITISGRVADKDSKPIEGACVTVAEAVPVVEWVQKNDSTEKYTYLRPSTDWDTTEFVATQPYMSKFEIKIYKYNPDSSLTVGILDETKKVLWQKKLIDDEIISRDWTTFDFDGNCLQLEQSRKYYIALKVNTTNTYGYAYIGEGKGKMAYRVWWRSADFATTDAEGNYSLTVDRYFTGALSAFHDDYFISEQSLQNVETELTDVNFAGLSKKITISGRVADKDSKPIEGACVTVAEAVPVVEWVQKNDSTEKNTYLRPSTDWYTTEFVALQPYMSKFEIKIYKYNPDSSLTVGILDESNKVLWQKKLIDDEIINRGWTTVEFANSLQLEQDRKYYIALKVNTTNTYSYAYIGEGKGKMAYRVWWRSADFATTDAEGNYSLKVDRYFTGTLHAYSDERTFNAITFSNLPDNATEKNFVEDGSNIEVEYKLDSITVVAPIKTNYKVGETFDKAGLTVYACYSDGSKVAVTDYEMSAIDLSSAGRKTVTVTYNGKTAQFGLTVGLNVHSIIYVVDNERYRTISDVEPGNALTPIAAPTKEGYTFSGWSQMPATMPDADVTVKGSFAINKHSITYMVDNEQYSVVENVAFGTALTPIAEPTKEGYTFSGWSQMPATMPDADVTVKGTFTKNEETTSAEQFAAEQLKIWAAGRTIVVENANDEIGVYDAMGRLVCRDAERLATARLRVNATGLYIVRVGSVAKRVFVE